MILFENIGMYLLHLKKDDNGTSWNPSDDLVTEYDYDVAGNLRGVNLPDGREIRYTIDALNRRIAKMVDGVYQYKLLYSGQLSPSQNKRRCKR